MDLTESIAPNSTQMDAEDLLGGPRTFTITEVREGPSVEQPFDVLLAEFPRAFRPSKTVRRMLVAAWGADATAYAGRRFTLFRDPDIKFGGQAVGGIRVSHLSHIDKPLSLSLMVTRGKRVMFTVQPLTDEPPPQPEPADPDAVTPAQLKKIGAAMRDLGMTDRDKALEFVAKTITREVSSRNELSKAEASALIAELEELASGQGEQQPAADADAGADPWAGDQP